MSASPSAMQLDDIPAPVVHARESVHQLLRSHKTHDIIPPHTRVVLLDSCLTAAQAFDSLRENGVCDAVVVHAGAFQGVVSSKDTLKWPEDVLLYNLEPDFASVDAEEPLLNVCRMLKETNAVPVIEGNMVMHTITRRQILSFLLKMLPHSPALMSLPLQQLPIITYNIRTIAPGESVEEAIRAMHSLQISALPVVENGRFIGIFGKDQLMWGRQGVVRAGEGVCLDHSQPLAAAFDVLIRFDRVFISRDANIVGVVCLSDLLRYFLDTF